MTDPNSIFAEVGAIVAPMLQRRMFVALAEPTPGPHDGELELLPEHLRHLVAMEQQGVLFAAGPFLEGGQPGKRSMYVLRASSEDEARAIMNDEPYHKRGMRTSTFHEWSLNEGRISISVDFSSQRAGVDSTPSSA